MAINTARQEYECAVRQLNDGPYSSSDVPALLEQFQLFKRTLADELISVESEELDDIATNDLPFLMIDVHLGSCWMQMPTVAGNSYSPQLRVEYLAAARHSFESFLTNCELVRALSAPEDQRWWQQWTSHSGDGAGSSRRTVSREEKIQRFRQSKALKQQLQVMESAAAQTVVDETQTRQRNLLLIQLAIQQTFDQLEMIVQESELLRMKLAADTQQHTADKSKHQDDDEMRLDSARGSRLPQSGPLLSSKGKVLRPFVITSNREEMVRNVFRPSHRLPTMSIDEFLKQEYERGNVLQGGTDGPKADKEDEEQDENAIYKKREWDNFKDENPRGWGNQKVNRG